MTIFGAIKIADDVEQAAVDTLSSWFPVYLREYEREVGLVPDNVTPLSHQLPKSYLKANQLDRDAADNLPAIIVVSPGLSPIHRPKQEGDGTYRVWFSIGIGVFVAANDRANTMKLVRVYTAIVRTIMLQQQSLGGLSDGAEWLDESYDDEFPFVDEQTISAGQVVFEIEVAGVVSRRGGPAVYGGPPPGPDPVTQPGSNWPTVAKTTATIRRIP